MDDTHDVGEVVGTDRAELLESTADVEHFEVADNPEPDWRKPGPPPANEPLKPDHRRRQPEPGQDVEESDAPIEEPPLGVPNRQAR